MGPGRRRGRGTARKALASAGLLRGDQRGDDAPWDGDAAAELAEPGRGADHDTEPASPDVPPAGGHVNAGKLIAAQLPERLRSGYAGQRGDDGSHRGKPPRRDHPLRGGERVHDPQSRRCGVSAIGESEAMTLELSSGARSPCGADLQGLQPQLGLALCTSSRQEVLCAADRLGHGAGRGRGTRAGWSRPPSSAPRLSSTAAGAAPPGPGCGSRARPC